ncbi:hypothetical protein CDEF62S_02898 [Castellaniella defragrans]
MTTGQMAQAAKAPYYYVPPDSVYPIRGSMSMLATLIGAALWVNDYTVGMYLCIAGIVCMLLTLYGWFGDAIHESESGLNSHHIDRSYRWSMTWFIFSEVMFFWPSSERCGTPARSPPPGSARWIRRPCCGRTSPEPGPTSDRPASSRRSTRSGPSGCPRSTRRCCCLRARL